MLRFCLKTTSVSHGDLSKKAVLFMRGNPLPISAALYAA